MIFLFISANLKMYKGKLEILLKCKRVFSKHFYAVHYLFSKWVLCEFVTVCVQVYRVFLIAVILL